MLIARLLPVALAVLAVNAAPALAQDPLCDPSLKVMSGRDGGYQPRGDRCEGIYAEVPISGSTIKLIASFTEGRLRFTPDGTALTVAWPGFSDQPVHLRARSLRPDLFYQMDTNQPETAVGYRWQGDVLATWQIEPRDLGILGWVSLHLGGTDRDIHLPLSVSQGETAPRRRGYQLLVVPGAELRELFTTIDRSNEAGDIVASVQPRQALGYGFYPPDSPIPVPVAAQSEAGIYVLTLTGQRRRDERESSRQFWFYQPEP